MSIAKTCLLGGLFVAVLLQGHTSPALLGASAQAASFSAKSGEEAEIQVLQNGNQFEFTERQTGSSLRTIRTAGDEWNYVSLMATDAGVPVVVYQTSALPAVDGLEFLEAATARAQEKNPERLQDFSETNGSGVTRYTGEETKFDQSLLEARVGAAVTPHSASFYMAERSGLKEPLEFHTVSVNQKRYGVFSTDHFAIDGLKPDTTYQVMITSTAYDPSDASAERESLSPGTTLVMMLETPAASLGAAIESTLATPIEVSRTQAYDHTTFIADDMVSMGSSAIVLGCSGVPGALLEFAGDGRSFSLPYLSNPFLRKSHRTAAFIEVDFETDFMPDVRAIGHVGSTTRYIDGVEFGTRTASVDGIFFLPPTTVPNYAQVTIHHEVGNPWCLAGAITYFDTVDFYPTMNAMEVLGGRFPVPHHEIAMRFESLDTHERTWRSALQMENQSFGCLLGVPACDPEYYSGALAGYLW